MKHGDFHRARLQHLGAQRRHFQHLFVGDLFEPPRLGNDARVGGVDAVHVGVDVAAVRLERRRHRHRAGVRAAAASVEMRLSGATPWKPATTATSPLLHGARSCRSGSHAVDAGRAMHGRGLDRNLPAQPGAGLHADGADSAMASSPAVTCSPAATTTSYSRCRHASVRPAWRRLGPGHQLVGLAGHGGDHHGDLVAALDLALHQAGDMADALDVGHRRAAEFHCNFGHLQGGACGFCGPYIDAGTARLNRLLRRKPWENSDGRHSPSEFGRRCRDGEVLPDGRRVVGPQRQVRPAAQIQPRSAELHPRSRGRTLPAGQSGAPALRRPDPARYRLRRRAPLRAHGAARLRCPGRRSAREERQNRGGACGRQRPQDRISDHHRRNAGKRERPTSTSSSIWKSSNMSRTWART